MGSALPMSYAPERRLSRPGMRRQRLQPTREVELLRSWHYFLAGSRHLCCRISFFVDADETDALILSGFIAHGRIILRAPLVCVLVYCLTIVGCVGPLAGTSNTLDQYGPYPENYKQVFRTYLPKAFRDPDSLRDVAISIPIQGKMASIPGWLVCLQTNAKDRSGKYEGPTRRLYLMRDGAIADVLMKAQFCDKVSLQPWPTAERRVSAKR